MERSQDRILPKFHKNAKGLVLKMYLKYCSVFMQGMFCALPYEPRIKLLNNGNVVGLRFGFRAVNGPNFGSPGHGFESIWRRDSSRN